MYNTRDCGTFTLNQNNNNNNNLLSGDLVSYRNNVPPIAKINNINDKDIKSFFQFVMVYFGSAHFSHNSGACQTGYGTKRIIKILENLGCRVILVHEDYTSQKCPTGVILANKEIEKKYFSQVNL
ncbi:hypothetical protein ACTFIY_002032 [Dictyostelium cf. discoideum]